MKQWFSGKFCGHYRGTPQKAAGLSPHPGEEHFRIEVYEALISDLELGATSSIEGEQEAGGDEAGGTSTSGVPTPNPSEPAKPANFHHTPVGRSLHQTHIPQVHLIDALRLGETIRATAHDVLMSELAFSHPARHDEMSFGRIEGRVSGWFRPPPEPLIIAEMAPPPGPEPVGWATDVVPSPEKGAALPGSSKHTPPPQTVMHSNELDFAETKNPARSGQRQPRATDEQLMPIYRSDRQEVELPSSEKGLLDEKRGPEKFPFFISGAAATVVLGLFASPTAMLVFAPTFLIGYGLRRWLGGVIPEVSGVRLLCLFVSAGQLLLGSLLLAGWAKAGCVSLSPLPLIFLLGGQMAAALLPRTLPFAITSGTFAVVLLQAYASWGPPMCTL